MTITLPEPLRQFVEEQVAAGRYESPSEYVAALVHRDREASPGLADPAGADFDDLAILGMTQDQLEAELLKGLDSGPATPMTREDWDRLKRRVIERAAAGHPR